MPGTAVPEADTSSVGSVTPFEYRFHLPRDPRAVGVTRTSLRAVLAAHGVPDLIDRAELLVSELLTNAIVHARSEAEMRLTWARETLRVAVRDTSPKPPDPVDASADAESGRGLRLIALVADRWDHFPVRADSGGAPAKVVWCEINRQSATW